MAIKKDKNGNFYIVNDEKSEKEKAAVSSAAKTIKTDKNGNFYIEAGSEAKQEFPPGNRYFSSGDGKVLTTQEPPQSGEKKSAGFPKASGILGVQNKNTALAEYAPTESTPDTTIPKGTFRDFLGFITSGFGLKQTAPPSAVSGDGETGLEKINNTMDGLGYSAAKGLAGFNEALTSTADFILGRPLEALGWEDNPFKKIDDYYEGELRAWSDAAEPYREDLGIAGEITTAVTQTLPSAVLALMTGGASATADLTAQGAGGLGALVQGMIKNPQFWFSFIQTVGNDYEEAKGMGASELAATAGAMISSFINAGIEMGGIQELPENVNRAQTSAIVEWIKSSIEEGGEELVQGFVNDLTANLLYNREAGFSTLSEMLREFAMGTAVGGVMGGGQIIAQSALQGKNTTQMDAAVNISEFLEYIEAQKKGEGALPMEGTPLPSLRDTFPGGEGKWGAAQTEASVKEKIGLSDFANNKSPVWRNVEYEDDATKASITKETHDRMVGNGQVVTVSDETMADVGEMFPDLRGMKKKERIPLIKQAMNTLKNNLRNYLSGLTGQNFEFEVNGKILEAKLYSTGINEVLEKVTKEKANMLYVTEGIFQNAQYLYSTPDYDGNPNIYRWNYFYTPVKIGEETVGVRIAVRDMAKSAESQIYNWGIKKDVSLDGGNYDPKAASSGVSSDTSDTSLDGVGGDLKNRKPHGVSSDTSDNIVPESAEDVKSENDERRNIAFTEDILAYRGANARGTVNARTTVQNAIESGILNDTGRTHEFVDLLAKLSSDKGIIFDFTNNARLAEKGLSLKDVTVNGYADKNGITVNVDSVKYLNTVVGHEITHVFEGTELYGPLRTALFECAITKGEFETRYAALQKLYANVEGADISTELTADLVGDYIFTDAEFVKSLAAKHRNVFQRIFDEIKYLCKIVTAGSREARELERAKKIFEEAYRAGGESANAAADAKYSLSETTDGKIVAVVDNDILKNIDTTSWDKTKKEAAKKAASDALKKFGHGIVVDGITRKVNKISRDEYTRSNNTERMYRSDPKVFADKMRAADAVDDIVVAATNWNRDGGLKHPRNDNFADFDHGQVLIMSGNAKYTAEVVVGITDSGDAVFYDVADMTPTTFDIKKSESSTAVTTQNAIDAIQEDSVGNSLSQTAQNVKRKNSLSENTQAQKRYGDYNVSGGDVKLEDIAPVREDAPMSEETAPYTAEGNKTSSTASGPSSPEGKAKGGTAQTEVSPLPSLRDTFPGGEGKWGAAQTEVSPLPSLRDTFPVREGVGEGAEPSPTKARLEERLKNSETELEKVKTLRAEALEAYDEKLEDLRARYDAKKDKTTKAAANLSMSIERTARIRADAEADYTRRIGAIESRISKINDEIGKDHTAADKVEREYLKIDKNLEQAKAELEKEFSERRTHLEASVSDKSSYISTAAHKLYTELKSLTKGKRASDTLGLILDYRATYGYDYSNIRNALMLIKVEPNAKASSDEEAFIRELIEDKYAEDVDELAGLDAEYLQETKKLEENAETLRKAAREEQTRSPRKRREEIIDDLKQGLEERGFDLDQTLTGGKELATFATVDNTPRRVMQKTFGYEAGGALADLTVGRVAKNESAAIRWLNGYTEKGGVLRKISDKYGIKPGSKKSRAAQMYAEGFFVNDKDELIAYGDAELARDFPNTADQEAIKGLAHDPTIRQIYDETLDMINASRERNGFKAIPRRENYFLHFRAMDDTFSTLGIPFNPNDIKSKDLPTDINGMTADLKPGQPFFTSSFARKGKRTSFDLLGGLEKYLNAAKSQIYHIDDIQTFRALHRYIADMYGQAHGLENLDALSEDEARERIEEVYSGHLSSFAKFLNEEANVLAGKTALIDRGLEGTLGRRWVAALKTVNKQVGANMVGFNAVTPFTNILPMVEAFVRGNKASFVKAFAQTVYGKVSRQSDGFAEASPVMIRRHGAEKFYKTPFEKAADMGYIAMGAVDDVVTEIIARTKYNELISKGKDVQTAHEQTDTWVSGIMADRSLGQVPLMYNSKMLGFVTKFQLEVRNTLDSQIYDVINEAKLSEKQTQNEFARNARTAARAGATMLGLAVAQHFFGIAFEKVFGYNPAFDIIDTIIKACGWDDDEDDEDTWRDNLEEGLFALLEDLPYSGVFMDGGRVPASAALPIGEFIRGEDEYGNDVPRGQVLAEALPYYLSPGGWNQIKKTVKGIEALTGDEPIAGSYTDSGDLRFPIADSAQDDVTFWEGLQTVLFGQYSGENAREYFDGGHKPLSEKQIQEFIDVGMDIDDYWDYREGLSDYDTLEEKIKYICSLDLTTEQKNILANNLTDRKEPIDLEGYENYGSLAELEFAREYPEKYEIAEAVGGYIKYSKYTRAINKIDSDKDENGEPISGSRKEKVADYLNSLDVPFGVKAILFRNAYNGDDTYNYDIVDYLNSREDISRSEMRDILTALGFRVSADGRITW